jgi:hypothetical protein
MVILTDYFSIPQAAAWCRLERESSHKNFQHLCETMGGSTAAFQAGFDSPFVGRNHGWDSTTVLRQALECGELRAAAVRATDGELVTLPPQRWRRSAENARPFAEALEGRQIPIDVTADGQVTATGDPIIAQSDLARWAGDDQPPREPSERPHDWPLPVSSQTSPADLAKIWMIGYLAAHTEMGRTVKQDDPRMISQCKQYTLCRHDDVRKAYSNAPPALRNPTPMELKASSSRS